MDRKVNYSSTSNSSDSETPPTKESKHKEVEKQSDRHRKKDRHHEKKSKRDKRRSSRDDYEKSKRRYKDADSDDDYHKSRRDKDRKESRRDKHRSERRVHDKHTRKHEEKKRKNRHRSKTPEKNIEKSSRRRSPSSSPERGEKKNLLKPTMNHISKYSQIAATSSIASSPQKTSIGIISKQPLEPQVELPAYYNPNVINVNKFAEQQKKRKLLWSGKKDEPTKDAAKWGGAKFSQDTDGTKASKFMRLMGIKDAPKPEATAAAKPSDDLFSNMEQQYEVARQVTHISRGVGLGFGSRPF